MHSAVCVITKERPTGDVLRAVMQCFEIGRECTIEECVEKDITAECLEDFSFVTSKYETLLSFVEHDYGLSIAPKGQEKSEKFRRGYVYFNEGNPDAPIVIERTNPNSKWDWWVLGGRYSGIFVPGCRNRNGPYVKPEDMAPGQIYPPNQLQRMDLRIPELRAEERAAWRGYFDRAQAVIGPQSIPAEKDFQKHPLIKALNIEFPRHNSFWQYGEIQEFWLPREVFLKRCEDRALVLTDYIKDGQWVERSDELFPDPSADDGWNSHFNAMLDSLDPQDWISIVDYHF